MTNRLIYGVQFLTQEEINQQEAISQNTQGTPEKRLRDMIDEIQKIDAKILNSSLKVVINALTSKREEIMEEFVNLYNREKNNIELLLKLETDYPNFIKHIFEDSSDDSDDDSSDDEEDDESDDSMDVDDLMHNINLRF